MKKKGKQILSFLGIVCLLAVIGYYFGEEKMPTNLAASQSSIDGVIKKNNKEINLASAEVQEIVQSEEFQKLLKDEKFLELMKSPHFEDLAKNPGYNELTENTYFNDLLKNQTFTQLVKAGQFSELEKISANQIE